MPVLDFSLPLPARLSHLAQPAPAVVECSTSTLAARRVVLSACAGALAGALVVGCSSGLSPPDVVLPPTDLPMAGRGQLEIPLRVPAGAPLRIEVSAHGVDVRIFIVDSAGRDGPPIDAPNRRMGVETALVENDRASQVIVRVLGNDHAGARGTVRVAAAVLPAATPADRRRIDATRLEGRACSDFALPDRGEVTARHFAQAAELHRRNRDALHAGIATLQEAATRYARLWDYPRAAELSAQARSDLESARSSALAAFALRLEGASLLESAELERIALSRTADLRGRGRERLTTAAERFDALDMPYEAAYAFNYRGVSYQYAGDHAQASADYSAALQRFKQAGDAPGQALSLQSLADLSREDGRLSDAVRQFEAALALMSEDEDPENFAHTLHNSALPLQELGQFDSALARYHEAGRILATLGDRDGEARALHGIGTVLRNIGQPERARVMIEAAIALRATLGQRREQAGSLNVLGQIFRDLGQLDAAIQAHNQALTLVDAPVDRARALLALAEGYSLAGRPIEARNVLEDLMRLELPKSHRQLGIALTELGTLESLSGNEPAALMAFDRALLVHRTNGSEFLQAKVLQRRAEAMLRAQATGAAIEDSALALQLLAQIGLQGTQAEHRATFLASQRGVAELHISALLRRADELRSAGRPREAESLIHEAFNTSDRARAHVLAAVASRGNVLSAAQQERLGEIYEQIASQRQLRERELDRPSPDPGTIDRLATRIELLRTDAALLESGGPPPSTSGERRPTTRRPQTPDSTIPDGVLLAEYFLGDNASWLFLKSRDSLRVHRLPPHRDLDPLLRRLHEEWRAPGVGTTDRYATARLVSEQLFNSLAKVPDLRHVLIVPDGALHIVPVATLAQTYLETAGRSAIPITIAPSLRTLATNRAQKVGDTGGRLMMIADPVYTRDDPRLRPPAASATDAPTPHPAPHTAVLIATAAESADPIRPVVVDDTLTRLPSTAFESREILSLARAAGRPTLDLTGPDANRTRLAASGQESYDIVHFAAHAWADSEDSALATVALSSWDRDGDRLDGALRAHDIARLRLNANLVVLSGCETALGREIHGEAPIGLSHAFLSAGASTVVATLWQVSDTSTALLMREFYRQLLVEGLTAPTALARAQRWLREQSRWSDPYHWAGVQLTSTQRTL